MTKFASAAQLATLEEKDALTESVPASARSDVLFVVNNLGIGGSERKTVRLANRLKEDGVDVSLACLNGPFTIEQGIRRDVPLRKLERTGKFSIGALLRLRQTIVRGRPATVIAVNLYQTLYVWLATRFLDARPCTVALVNTTTFNGNRTLKRLYQFVLGRFDVSVHGCEVQRGFWFKTNYDAWRKSIVIYNGVDSNYFEYVGSFEAAKRLRASLGIRPEALLIGTVGRLSPEKNQEVLLTTLRRLRVARVDAHLILAGDGRLRHMLERQAADQEIADRVHFIGEIEDVRPVLAALDVFVLPSISESFSNAALEAMSMARPVILSNVGGAPEMITDGVEGYIVSPSELPARLPTLISALYSDQCKRRQMGAAARRRVVECFSVPAMVAGYRGLMQNGEKE